MTIVEMERHCEALFTTDQEVWIEACEVDGGGIVALTVDSATEPLTFDGWTTFSAQLLGPADAQLMTPGRHRAYHAGRAFTINLTRLSRRGSLVSYAAFVLEPTRQFV